MTYDNQKSYHLSANAKYIIIYSYDDSFVTSATNLKFNEVHLVLYLQTVNK